MSLPLSPSKRRYGFKTSPKSYKDLGAYRILASTPIPPIVDLENFVGPVKDQGQEGSCTAHAGSENLEFLFRKYRLETPILSPQFLYYKERERDGTLDQGDCGSYGRTSVEVMQTAGCCTLASDPYNSATMNVPPTSAQMAEALKYLAGTYYGLYSVDGAKQCLASGYTFLIGFNVYENFETDIGANGIMPVPNGGYLGGHEVLVIGYDDNFQDPISGRTGYFKIRNSWGSSWGANGDFHVAYSDFPSIVIEAWVQHLGFQALVPRPVVKAVPAKAAIAK